RVFGDRPGGWPNRGRVFGGQPGGRPNRGRVFGDRPNRPTINTTTTLTTNRCQRYRLVFGVAGPVAGVDVAPGLAGSLGLAAQNPGSAAAGTGNPGTLETGSGAPGAGAWTPGTGAMTPWTGTPAHLGTGAPQEPRIEASWC